MLYLLLACKPSTEADLDGDGFPVPEDCDDSRADVHPDAFDFDNDGLDADCDGTDGRGPLRADILPLAMQTPTRHVAAFGLCDLTGDGILDLITARHFEFFDHADLRIFAGPLSQITSVPDLSIDVPQIEYVTGVHCVDLDADGTSDLLVQHTNGLQIFYPSPTGITPETPSATLVGGSSSILAGDFDGDGEEEVLVIRGGEGVQRLPSARYQDVTPLRHVLQPVPGGASMTILRTWPDVDGDGDPELLATDGGIGQVFDDLDALQQPPLHELRVTSAATAGDFDGDGALDDVLSYTEGALDVQLDALQPDFVDELGVAEISVANGRAGILDVVGDVDGDGHEDAYLRHTSVDEMAEVRILSGALVVDPPVGRINPVTLLRIQIEFPTRSEIETRFVDLDQDGINDVIISVAARPGGIFPMPGAIYGWFSGTP